MPDTSDIHENGLVCGYLLDGKGGARQLAPEDIDTDFGPDKVVWLHFDFTHPRTRSWIQKQKDFNDHMAQAMLADDSRPRCMVDEHGVLTVLRGINLNPGSEMEDMVSIRVWMNRNRIISTRRRRLKSVLTIREQLEAGNGPTGPPSFLVSLIGLLGSRIGEAIDVINEQLDDAESSLQQSDGPTYRALFGEIRRQTARMRRYLAPQREALDRLSRVQSDFFSNKFSLDIFEQTNWMTLFIEDLDLARERAMVAQEELLNMLAHEQNSKMFILSIVAAVFLPLAFFTGLMGMNVAGLPGTESPWSFYIVLILMFAAAGFIMWLFKRKKWF